MSTEHLTAEQVAAFVAQRLSAGELLAVDDHLAACPDCRRRLRAAWPVEDALRTWQGVTSASISRTRSWRLNCPRNWGPWSWTTATGCRFVRPIIASRARMVQMESTSHPSWTRMSRSSRVWMSMTSSACSQTPLAVLTAKKGEYQFARGTLEAWDSVFVQSLDGSNRKLRTSHIIYDRDQNQIRSDSAFVYESPTEVLTGNSFVSDPNFKNVVTRQPKGRQRGEGMLLPGQKP